MSSPNVSIPMKSIQRIIGCLFLITVWISCSRPCCDNIDVSIHVTVKDQAGNNLLDPATTGFFKQDEIRFYSLKNGSRTQIFNINNNLYNFILDGAHSSLTLYAGDETMNAIIVQWRGTDEDLFEYTTERTKNSIVCTVVKCNGTTRYDPKSGIMNNGRQIEIIK